MIGNDIVDLQEAKKASNWKRRGFLNKVFTQKEQHYILHAPDQDRMVWRLWSMKESAYKAHVRISQQPFFNPLKLSSTINSNETGEVFIDEDRFKINTTMNDQYIYSVVESKFNGLEKIGTHTPTIPLLQQCLSRENINIIKDKHGIPFLITNHKKHALSITHHGAFTAFILSKIDL